MGKERGEWRERKEMEVEMRVDALEWLSAVCLLLQ